MMKIRVLNRASYAVAALSAILLSAPATAELSREGDRILIVGGTESGVAAAVQAVRMGVHEVVLVNDTDWLGGQFSSEALAAIDENRGPQGYDQTVPFPRSGMFKEVIDRIEARNNDRYGEPRPGNTRVITTARPSDAAAVFEEYPREKYGWIHVISNRYPVDVEMKGDRIHAVTFASTTDADDRLRLKASVVIDATDWGDVVRLSGAAYEFGPDLRETYGEPLAPVSREGYPLTDMNPLTYCMVIEETDDDTPIPAPAGYDPRNYRDHAYPKDPLWLYGSRRIIDRYGFDSVTHPDVLLLCFPAFDYPTDVWPAAVAKALEQTAPGASKKNIAELTRAQRQIVYDDAKRYSLGFLHYLQTEVHDAMEDKTHSFRRFKLSEEFGTPDNMPPKPYLRESLRTKALYMTRQQDTTGHDNDARNYANVMFHDTVLAWQFEYDFHPTGRRFLDDDPAGPWQNYFREGRTWGPPYSGLATFPLRSLVPEQVDGLIVAQKNLGYTSLVSSALRLHDQSMAVGQAAGAAAAVTMRSGVPVREIPYDRQLLARVQEGLCSTSVLGGIPAALWPFRDLSPDHAAFTAANMLAVTGALPLAPDETTFRPDDPATDAWRAEVVARSLAARDVEEPPSTALGETTRGAFVAVWWDAIRHLPWKPFARLSENDADGDGIPDRDDALLFSGKASTWPAPSMRPDEDGLLDRAGVVADARLFNFTEPGSLTWGAFVNDSGAPYTVERGYGWKTDLSANHRVRGRYPEPARDSFLFTRSHHTWECDLPNGDYQVTVCIGDASHEQRDQNVAVEGDYILSHVDTRVGRYREKTVPVTVEDGRLTIEIGRPGSTSNTCLNWVVITER